MTISQLAAAPRPETIRRPTQAGLGGGAVGGLAAAAVVGTIAASIGFKRHASAGDLFPIGAAIAALGYGAVGATAAGITGAVLGTKYLPF